MTLHSKSLANMVVHHLLGDAGLVYSTHSEPEKLYRIPLCHGVEAHAAGGQRQTQGTADPRAGARDDLGFKALNLSYQSCSVHLALKSRPYLIESDPGVWLSRWVSQVPAYEKPTNVMAPSPGFVYLFCTTGCPWLLKPKAHFFVGFCHKTNDIPS